MISGTVFSAYIGEDKPIFTGILIESEPGKINFVGIDGIRLALRSAAFDGKEGINVVVPAKALKEAVRIFEDGDGEISLYVNDRAFLMIKQDIRYTPDY